MIVAAQFEVFASLPFPIVERCLSELSTLDLLELDPSLDGDVMQQLWLARWRREQQSTGGGGGGALLTSVAHAELGDAPTPQAAAHVARRLLVEQALDMAVVELSMGAAVADAALQRAARIVQRHSVSLRRLARLGRTLSAHLALGFEQLRELDVSSQVDNDATELPGAMVCDAMDAIVAHQRKVRRQRGRANDGAAPTRWRRRRAASTIARRFVDVESHGIRLQQQRGESAGHCVVSVVGVGVGVDE